MSSYGWQLVVGFGFLLSYVALVLWARRMCITRSNQAWTSAHRSALHMSLQVLDSSPERKPGDEGLIGKLLELLCVRKSADIAEWVLLHEAQRQSIWFLPEEQVRARLHRAIGQLDELAPARRTEWRRRYDELSCAGAASLSELRSALIELLAELHNARDGRYAQLNGLYAKAMWLMFAAVLPLGVLLILGYGVLLVAGAVGGLISRLQRLVYAQSLPTAYGTSWVPLFCAPVLGALAAWAGLNLITFLQAAEVIDLRNLVDSADDLLVPPPAVVGLAVLFGFSERLLNKTGEQAEKIVGADEAGPDAGAPSLSPPVADRREPSPALNVRQSTNGDVAHTPA